MVELEKATYKRIMKQIELWGGAVSLTDTPEWYKGECDICHRETRAQLHLQETTMGDDEPSLDLNDPGWLLCPYHAREVGLAW